MENDKRDELYTNAAVIDAYFDWEEKQLGVITNCEAFQAGVDYAATLRQQAEPAVAVSDDVVTAAARVLCAYESRECNVDKDDNWNLYAEDFKAQARPVVEAVAPLLRAPAGSAALAQNTQGDTEPVAWLVSYTRSRTGESARDFYGSHVAAELGAQALRDADQPMIPMVIPLYTHAERATVPDDILRTAETLRNELHYAACRAPEGWDDAAAESQAKAQALLDYLAAAPSHPKDAQS